MATEIALSQSSLIEQKTVGIKQVKLLTSKWLAAKELYQSYGVPPSLIAVLLNVKDRTVERRAKRETWQITAQEDLLSEHQKLTSALYRLVEAHFEHVARLENDELFGEKKTKALTALAATLEKLSNVNMKTKTLMGKQHELDGEADKKDNFGGFAPAQIMDFREKLTKRIEGFSKEGRG